MYLQFKKADGKFKFLLDCIFTNVVYLVVVFVWRDLWTALDLHFYPDDPVMSNGGSLVSVGFQQKRLQLFKLRNFQLIGAVLSVICFAFESTVNRLFEKNKPCRIIVHDAFMLVCLLATINVWRGLWNFGLIYTRE